MMGKLKYLTRACILLKMCADYAQSRVLNTILFQLTAPEWLLTSDGRISIPYIITLKGSMNDLKTQLFDGKKTGSYCKKELRLL